jgi:Na+/proline symporter
MLIGSVVFLWFAVAQHGGWEAIVARVQQLRPEALQQTPPTLSIDMLTLLMLFVQGLFFAGSPTAGEGMTAQRFMAARSERHAVGGQLFNAVLALSLRTVPLIGLGIVALSLFWTADPQAKLGTMPEGMTLLQDPAFAWGELIRRCTLPIGVAGLLVAAEVAAYMSTLSSLINWGGSFVVNDLMPARLAQAKGRIWVSRLATLFLFVVAAVVTVLFVDDMVSWFLFINSAMVVFLLPLAWFRFFWWRFNVWGELSAIILGLPLSIVVWFVLDFQHAPLWQGLGCLFGLSIAVLTTATLLTPPESMETLTRFYQRCHPPGLWGPVRRQIDLAALGEPPLKRIFGDSVLGILACLALVLATNALYVADWPRFWGSVIAGTILTGWLLKRILRGAADEKLAPREA